MSERTCEQPVLVREYRTVIVDKLGEPGAAHPDNRVQSRYIRAMQRAGIDNETIYDVLVHTLDVAAEDVRAGNPL